MRELALSDDILMKIDKPARYIGNELNSVKKIRPLWIYDLLCAFRMSTRSVCPILGFRFSTRCSTAERMSTVSVSIRPGRIFIKS